jgi:hypothetical protein
MNDLEKYFFNVSEKSISKWRHYFKVYDRYFSSFRDRPINMLEIGVQNGGSLRMWRDYFHKDSTIVGIDIDPECKQHENESVNIHIGSQNDKQFVNQLITRYEKFDIIIDDGSHNNDHQVNTFTWMFPCVSDGGIYLIEDMHTSYWPAHGGGFKMPGTCVEFAKNLIDDVNMHMALIEPTYYTNNVGGIHFYDGVVVIEKYKREYKPYDLVCKNGEIAHLPEKVKIN